MTLNQHASSGLVYFMVMFITWYIFMANNKDPNIFENFPVSPPPGDMTRKHRMKRLHDDLKSKGLYVRSVQLDESSTEQGFFIVAVDEPYSALRNQGQVYE